MSQLIALVFEDMYSADEACAALRRMAGEGLLELDETAVIQIDREGKKRVRQDVDLVSQRQRVGQMAGIVAAACTGILPLISLGTLAGRLIGGLTDNGITNRFIKDVERQIHPGMSVLLMCGKSDDARRPEIIERLRPWQPRMLVSDLPPDLESAIRADLDRPPV